MFFSSVFFSPIRLQLVEALSVAFSELGWVWCSGRSAAFQKQQQRSLATQSCVACARRCYLSSSATMTAAGRLSLLGGSSTWKVLLVSPTKWGFNASLGKLWGKLCIYPFFKNKNRFFIDIHILPSWFFIPLDKGYIHTPKMGIERGSRTLDRRRTCQRALRRGRELVTSPNFLLVYREG